MNYTKINNIFGWIVFAISLTTYWLTVEPSVSFWDCGEYISTASNLEVGHPPGASLFQILGAIFSLFTFGNTSNIAYAINMMSAVSSAFSIMFLFWVITFLSKKILSSNSKKISTNDTIAIIGSGLLGSLAFTFSDTFWFSAVEGEVYAMSTLFTMIVFWLITKWETRFDEYDSDKWIVLISFVIGLSFGVHLMVILAIPTVVLIYYFKKYSIDNFMDFAKANLIAVIIFAIAFKFIFPYTLRFFGFTEVFFVNNFGLPFHFGTITALLIYCVVFFSILKYSHKRKNKTLNTLTLSIMFLLIGTSSWLMIAVRSNANPPIDENNPDSAVGLLRYYNREQYGEWPVVYGQYFSAFENGLKLDSENPYLDSEPKYERDNRTGKYEIIDDGKQTRYNYDKNYTGLFPRMYSSEQRHIRNYKRLAGVVGEPTLLDNIYFFFDYQLGYMYWRYFMWNFSGKQNDIQGNGDILHGNWKTGIKPLDKIMLGSQDNLPKDLSNNRGDNSYYLLPLIFGILGLYFHYLSDKKSFYAVLILFFVSGIGIIIYTNVKPYEPRERDYALVNSFMVFCIWIGLGVLFLYKLLKEKTSSKIATISLIAISILAVPTIMAKENWDDHDRSNRYVALNMAKNYLKSLDKNAILFVHGDNDTFPLWYIQEVEGYRKDVKVINLSLLNTDWYIDQMKRKTLDSAPIPSQLTHDKYKGRNRDFVYFVRNDNIQDTIAIKEFVNWIDSDDDFNKIPDPDNESQKLLYYPSNKISLPNKSGDGKIIINIESAGIYKKDIIIYDILANNNWERPIYFSVGGGLTPETYSFLSDYFELEGFVYKLTDKKVRETEFGFGGVNTDKMYTTIKNFEWGNLGKQNIYHDEQIRNQAVSYRLQFARLSNELILEGKNKKATEVLDIINEKFPQKIFENNTILLPIIENYYKLKEDKKADILTQNYAKDLFSKLDFYNSFEGNMKYNVVMEILGTLKELNVLNSSIESFNKDLSEKYNDKFSEYLVKFKPLLESIEQ